MNRRFCWVLLVLTLSLLIACVPADAAQSGQAGASSSPGDHGAQAGASAGPATGNHQDSSSTAGNSGESQSGDLPVSDSATGGVSASTTSLDSSVQSGTAMAGPGSMNGMSGTAGENEQSGQGNSGSGFSSGAGTLGGNSGGSSSQSGDSPVQMQGQDKGNQGSDRQESQSGSTYGKSEETARSMAATAGSGTGSSRGNGGGTAGGSADTRGLAAGLSGLDRILLFPGNIQAAMVDSGPRDSTSPAPGSGRTPSPQRQQQGPPAKSGGYPCAPAQTSPLPPVSGQGQNESKDDAQSRQRSRRSGLTAPVIDTSDTGTTTSTQPSLPFFPLSLLLFGGYRRISKSNVLEHDARQVIYEAVCEYPGIEVKTLVDTTGINENTLRYHLAMLVSTGKITCFIRPGVVRYFQNQNAFSPFEQVVFHYLRTDTPRWIVGLLANHPGQTRKQIADAIGISGPSVTRQMEHLIKDGIVENRLPGRSNHYTLTKDAALALTRLVSGSTVMRHDAIPVKPLLVTAH